IHVSITADVDPNARLSGRSAAITRFDGLAVFAASVARVDVAVVAGLAGTDFTVAADDGGNAGLTGGRAHVIGLYDTGARTTISRQGVAVVTSLGRIEIDLAIAAGGRRDQHTVFRRIRCRTWVHHRGRVGIDCEVVF